MIHNVSITSFNNFLLSFIVSVLIADIMNKPLFGRTVKWQVPASLALYQPLRFFQNVVCLLCAHMLFCKFVMAFDLFGIFCSFIISVNVHDNLVRFFSPPFTTHTMSFLSSFLSFLLRVSYLLVFRYFTPLPTLAGLSSLFHAAL